MQAFFRQVFDPELTPQQLAECRECTQGWVTALQFARQVVQQQMPKHAGAGCPATVLTDLTAVLHQSEQEIYDYFVEEVYDREEKQIQYLLMRLSLLKTIELETCERLYPAANCAVILSALLRRNVFISLAGNGHGEEYRLHPLFRCFLRRRLLEEIGREGVAAEQAHIAYYFLKRGKSAQAIRHLSEAEEFDRASMIISEKGQKGQTGQTWTNSGALRSLMRSSEPRDEISASTTPHKSAGAQTAVITSEPSFDLTIKLIGPVEIYRDPQQPFATAAWTTRRTRDIFCFIASLRHRRVSKETIINTFWGETDLKSVLKNFNPTISHIRKALNSNQPLKENFLIYRDGDFLLDPRFSYSIDTEEFDRLVAEAEAARRAGQRERQMSCCESAVELYRGEFMQGCLDNWPFEQRLYYREQYQFMLKTLTLAAQEALEWPRSLQLAHKILKDDPFCEEIHCLVMRAYAAEGNRLAVKKQYLSLQRMLHKELGVEPAEETRALYFQLLG
jgi:two-component SAPR family response regulator